MGVLGSELVPNVCAFQLTVLPDIDVVELYELTVCHDSLHRLSFGVEGFQLILACELGQSDTLNVFCLL